MSKLKKIFTDLNYLKFCIYTGSAAILLYLFYFILRNFTQIWNACGNALHAIGEVLSPLFIGLILAYLLTPAVEWLDLHLLSRLIPLPVQGDPLRSERRKKLRRTLSVLITFLFILLLLCALLYFASALIIGQLSFQSIDKTIDGLTAYFLQYKNVLNQLAEKIPDSGLQEQAQEMIASVVVWVSNHFSLNGIISFVSSVSNGILNVVLGVVVSVYLIKDKEYFLRLWRKSVHLCVPMKAAAGFNEILNDINTVLSCFLRGQLLDALIIAILSSVVLTACGLEFSVLIGCFAGLANVIPYFGPLLGMIPAFLVGLLTDGFGKGLLAVVLLLLIQQIDGNILYPKIVGASMGLHPIFVLLAVAIGGHFWGIAGMLLAVPAAAILKQLIIRAVENKENKPAQKNQPDI